MSQETYPHTVYAYGLETERVRLQFSDDISNTSAHDAWYLQWILRTPCAS